jgi:hypothetical protein
MSKNARQHYVPQFYLKNFCNSKGTIYCYDKYTKKVIETSTNDIAVSKSFYDLDRNFLQEIRKKAKEMNNESILQDIETLDKRVLEQCFTKLENKILIPTYQTLLYKKNINKLKYTEKLDFFVFVAIQHLRTDEFRRRLKHYYEGILLELAKNHFNSDFPGIEILISEIEAKFQHYEYLKTKNLVYFADKLIRRKWVVLINKSTLPLWTSDNPVSLKNDYNFQVNYGILSPGMEIRFPLSSNLLLYSYDPNTSIPKNNRESLSDYELRISNQSQLLSSTRFVYCPSQNFEWVEKFLDSNPHYRNPERKRFKFLSEKDKIDFYPT